MSKQIDDDLGVSKQFAIVVEPPGDTPNYVDARNPRMIGHTSTINPPPPITRIPSCNCSPR